MRGRSDQILVILAIIISVALTAITLTAVAQQGETLRQRELADLRDSAARTANARLADLRVDLNRAFDAAGRELRSGELDGLEHWAAAQRQWLMVLVDQRRGDWIAMPFTPGATPLPPNRSEAFETGERLEFVEQDLSAALDWYDRLTDSDDPLTRARALLAAGACRRKLGLNQAAARDFRDAAEALGAHPQTARHSFAAQLAVVDCWLAAGHVTPAREALLALLRAAQEEHPSRYSSADIEMVRKRVERLAPVAGGADVLLWELLNEAIARAKLRDAVERECQDLARIFAARRDAATESIVFVTARLDAANTLVVAIRGVGGGQYVALASSARDLIRRYWGAADPQARWNVVLPDGPTETEPIYALGNAFGDAVLIPTPGTVARLETQSFRRLALLASTAAGTTAAWVVVIWMMMRAMGRQRELVKLQRRFVADVSHELKTPLALIRLHAETLYGGRVQDAARVQHYLETITRESERLTVLLDSILDFSQIESGRKKYEFVECDAADAARQAWALFEPQLAADGFTARLEIADDLPLVRADPQALQQLIVNLMQNAHRYAGESKFVRLALGRERGLVTITVEDRGIGMSRQQLKRVGDSFYRSPDPRVRRTRGTGLGLAIVQHIIAAHGGRMEVQSRPGAGSTFVVRLPALTE